MPIKKKPVTPEAMKLRMADLCARSEQCEYDIAQKLFKAGLNSTDRLNILNFLKEERFIDNFRFARSFARDKCRFSAWGPYKIRLALAAKRIPSDIVTRALEEVEEKDWRDALNRTASSKLRSLPLHGENAQDNRQKLYRFIISRGFPSNKASEKVKQMIAETREEK